MFPMINFLLDIFCQPNPRLRFKERIDGKSEWNFTYAGNNVGCPVNMEDDMIKT